MEPLNIEEDSLGVHERKKYSLNFSGSVTPASVVALIAISVGTVHKLEALSLHTLPHISLGLCRILVNILW